MTDEPSTLQRFMRELKRRRVYRVAAVYVVVAFVILQAGDIIFPALKLPEWTMTLVVALVALGFPVALVLAWAFQMTAEGVVRAEPGEETETEPAAAPERAALGPRIGLSAFVLALIIAAGFFTMRSRDTATEAMPLAPNVVAIMPFSVVGRYCVL